VFAAVLIVSACNKTDKDNSGSSIDTKTDIELQSGVRSGEIRFANYCAACHQLGGQGTEGRVPPLDGSPWVSGSEQRLIRIVLGGLRGPIVIAGETYNLEMPAFGTLFKDQEAADLLSYVRQQYGAPSSSITPAKVSEVRDATRDRIGYWTVAELLEVP
jgi:mono/diheme cytochrome c family protein